MSQRPVLRFSIAALLPLLDHTEAAPRQSVFPQDLADPTLHLPGATPDEHGFVRPDEVDHTKLAPSLAFVKDEGAYLMSFGEPGLKKDADRHVVVYAEGYGPDVDYDALRDACGGDDFGERVLAAEVRRAAAAGATWFCIVVNEDSFEMFSE